MSSSDEDEARPRLGLGAAKKRKADAYLGVFGDDDDEAPRRGLGGKRPAKGGNDSKPMAFVSAAAPAPPPPPPAAPPAAPASNADFRAQFLAEPPAPAPAPPRPAFGGRKAAQPEWMKHTKGVGFKMLEKMGFTGRLGKEEQGVSRHVEVTKRPEGMGLGFAAARGFVEEAKLGANVQLQRELGHAVPDAAEELLAEEKADEHRAKRRRQFRDAASMATAVDKLDAAVALNRSSEAARRAAALTAAQDGAAAVPPESRLAARLREDLDARLNGEESFLRDADGRIDAERDRRAGLDFDVSTARDGAARLRRRADRLADFDAALAAVEAAAGSGDVAAFKAALERARSRFPEEWALCGVAAATYDAAAPLARAAFAGWEPLEDPGRAAEVVAALRPEALFDASYDVDAAAPAWRLLLDRVAGAAARAALQRSWAPGGERDGAALALVGALFPRGGGRDDAFVSAVLAPRLLKLLEAEIARARRGGAPAGRPCAPCVAPWLAHLDGDDRSAASDAAARLLRLEMSRAARDGGDDAADDGFADDDARGRAGLRAVARAAAKWKPHVDARDWSKMASSNLARAVADAARGGWVVYPPGQMEAQDWRPVDALRGLGASLGARDGDLRAVVLGEIAPRWVSALRGYLVAEDAPPDPLDVADFYVLWRDRFLGNSITQLEDDDDAPPPPSEGAAAACREVLRCGLQMMEVYLADAKALRRLPAPPLAAPSSFERVQLAAAAAAAPAPAPAPAPAAPGWRAAVDGAGFVVFADVVARFAAEHDVVYRPKIGRSHDGKQLYAFGKATMYMDRSVTFVKKPDTGLFKPVPLEELLALAS